MRTKRVYLGTVAVVPRADLKRHMERPITGVTDSALESHLESVLSLPKAPSAESAEADDCALDIFVGKHQSGEAWEFVAGDLSLPLFWRPAVEISSRLRFLRSGKSITTAHVKKKLSWSEYLGRMLSVRGLLGFSSPFTQEDMKQLLDQALFETLSLARAKL